MQTVTLVLNPDYKPAVGIGTKIKRVVHKLLDAVPMPAKTRKALKECGGCAKREQSLNAMQRKYRAKVAARRKAKISHGRDNGRTL